ncbi:S41 family peptidase, partial [Klebsiella pneumoniae]|uniref:S41 family peptidase n=1 Tax=Klebsiella pneumoniae TaxID=573 RepID=UPI00226D8859
LVQAALEDLADDGLTGLVLDVRANLGGSHEETAQVAGLFVDGGPLFQRKAREGAAVVQARGRQAWRGGLAVLVARGTVGEAEVLANALRERAGAKL